MNMATGFIIGIVGSMIIAIPIMLIVALILLARYHREMETLAERVAQIDSAVETLRSERGVQHTSPAEKTHVPPEPSKRSETIPFPAQVKGTDSPSGVVTARVGGSTSQMPIPPERMAASERPSSIPVAPTSWTPSLEDDRTVENLVGRNVIGIVASILVFIGLIFLGVLIVPTMNDIAKIVSLFMISTALVAAGGLLTKARGTDVFTSSLLGCGVGAFFISIMLTHLYFHALSDIPAFLLLLLWMAFCFLVVRWTRSLSLSIICHVGMIVSVVFAYTGGISDSKLILLILYQIASTAVICTGNIICCRQTYRFGLFASLVLIIIASCAMWGRFFGSTAAFASSLPVPLICAAFLLQFIGASFLSYLLFVSIIRSKENGLRLMLHVMNALLWITALLVDLAFLAAKVFFVLTMPPTLYLGAPGNYTAMLLFCGTALLGLALYILFMLMLHRHLEYDRSLQRSSVLLAAIMASLLLMMNLYLMNALGINLAHISGLAFLAVALMIIDRVTGDDFHGLCADALLVIDALLMIMFGYTDLTSRFSLTGSILYLALLLMLMVSRYRMLDEETRTRRRSISTMEFIVTFELSILVILLGSNLTYRVPISIVIVATFLLALHLVGLARPTNPFIGKTKGICSIKVFRSIIRGNEFLLFFATAWLLSTLKNSFPAHIVGSSTLFIAQALLALAMLLELVLICLRVKGAARENDHPFEFLLGLSFSLLVLGSVQGYTDLFEQQYVFSMVSMLTAFASILVGFLARMKTLRLYGLVIILLCVLKLVTLDLGGLDSMMRVATFIGGGAICFAISALYNYAVKRLKTS